MDKYGEIYCITSPSGKKYVGQCLKHLSNGRKHGYIGRWKEHIRDSTYKNCCRLLNASIRKYGPENFNIEILKECPEDELNYYEKYYITNLNTKKPNGYNLTDGGNVCKQSEETCELKRLSMIGKNLGKTYEKRARKRTEDSELPKYVRHYRDTSGKEGYRINNHPNLKDKSFLSKNVSMDEKLQLALNYLNNVPSQI
jgi:group I intron endonuclease